MADSMLVIYHGGCRDGFCAAWAISLLHPLAEFVPGYYGQAPPDVAGREVVIADFSYPRDAMESIAASARSLTVLDHHKTAEAALSDLRGAEVVFDMNRSGAGIVWDHFNKNVSTRPWLVDYVEDRDLWRHALPESEVINSWIGTIPFTFEAWSAAHADMVQDWMEVGDQLATARVKGAAVLAKVRQYVAEVRKNAHRIAFEGYDVPIVNAPQVDVSELGHTLAQGETFAMAWWQRADGVFQYSLRSIGDFDVSELAKRHGGGGHKNAAGFQSAVLL